MPNAFSQAGRFDCFLSHFFELPSIKSKRACCCIRFSGRFILSHKIVLHASMIKLCTMSEIGHYIYQQCKAYCILKSQLCFLKSTLALRKTICPQMHCTQYDPLVLHGKLYLSFLSLLFLSSQNLYK